MLLNGPRSRNGSPVDANEVRGLTGRQGSSLVGQAHGPAATDPEDPKASPRGCRA